jgi:hypothetical protein
MQFYLVIASMDDELLDRLREVIGSKIKKVRNDIPLI